MATGKNRNKRLTLSGLVDAEVCRRLVGFPDSVLGNAREVAAVASIAHRLDAQHGAVWHLIDEVALATVADASPALAPVDLWRGVAGRLAEEAHGFVVQHFLVLRGERDARGICNIIRDMVKRCA